MKPGDRVKIETSKSKSMEKLEREGVAWVKLILKAREILELESKELTFVKLSPNSSNHAIVKTPDGNEYEVNKELLKEIE
jgi:hypothetical protein